jgi:isopentenyl-diphosphate delta-isomerase
MSEFVILVDENDVAIGSMEKLEAHQKKRLHRAFSILVWNSDHQLLIHQRAASKYHSANLWTNTCCSHPRVEEETLEAANRRLLEEMGFQCELSHAFQFIYEVELENGLSEYELDHVFIGKFDGNPNPNSNEAQAYRWEGLEELKQEIREQPENFTFWFKKIIQDFEDQIKLQ